MASEVPMEYVVVRDPDLQEIAAGAAAASRTTSTTLFVSDITDDHKLLEEIVVKFGVESVSNPTQRALRWDEITKTFNSLSLTLSGKTMTKDQVRRKWNNMKKLARKKWESDDPAVHKREPQNLENSAQFEIIRQEEDAEGGATTTTIIVLDQTDKSKSKSAPTSNSPFKTDPDGKSFIFKSSGSIVMGNSSKEKEGSGDEDADDDEADEEEESRRRRKRKKRSEEDRDYGEVEEQFGPQDEIQAKKRIRWEKRLRNAESVFQKKKAEIESKIKEYQEEINEVTRLNNDLQQKILEKKIALELEEEDIQKVDMILEKAGSMEIYA